MRARNFQSSAYAVWKKTPMSHFPFIGTVLLALLLAAILYQGFAVVWNYEHSIYRDPCQYAQQGPQTVYGYPVYEREVKDGSQFRLYEDHNMRWLGVFDTRSIEIVISPVASLAMNYPVANGEQGQAFLVRGSVLRLHGRCVLLAEEYWAAGPQ